LAGVLLVGGGLLARCGAGRSLHEVASHVGPPGSSPLPLLPGLVWGFQGLGSPFLVGRGLRRLVGRVRQVSPSGWLGGTLRNTVLDGGLTAGRWSTRLLSLPARRSSRLGSGPIDRDTPAAGPTRSQLRPLRGRECRCLLCRWKDQEEGDGLSPAVEAAGHLGGHAESQPAGCEETLELLVRSPGLELLLGPSTREQTLVSARSR
jgi:hypothetical protein